MTRLLLISLEHPDAQSYLECLRHLPEVELAGLAEPDSRRLPANRDLLNAVQIFEDYREMLQKVSADGAIVCSANAKHKEMVIDCARAGLPVLCETPLATRTADAREMLAISQAHEVLLGLCSPIRFSDALIQAKRLIEQGELGKILAVNARNRGTMPGDWFVDPELSGGGAIMAHAADVIGALRWLSEAEFTSVFARASSVLHNLDVEDAGLLTLEMSNEAIVTLDTSWSRPKKSSPVGADISLTIIAARGVLNLELFPWTLNYYSEQAGKHLVISHDGDLTRQLLENFVRSLSGEATIAGNGVDGLRMLEVVEAAYKSVSSGTVVAL
jgi:predicted dehydrogenase